MRLKAEVKERARELSGSDALDVLRALSEAALDDMTRAIGEGPVEAAALLALRQELEGAKRFWAAIEAAIQGQENVDAERRKRRRT